MNAAIAENWVLVVQTALLSWYAWETLQIRRQANEENINLKGQLAAMEEQTRLNAQLLERQIKAEAEVARPFLVWLRESGIDSSGRRTIFFKNRGAIVRVVEWRCSTGPMVVPDIMYLDGDHEHSVTVSNAQWNVFFGLRYENKLGHIETVQWVIPVEKKMPRPCNESFEAWSVTLPKV